MDKLKPCPFCGSNQVIIDDISTEDEEYYMIYCETCGAATSFGDASETKEGATELWNRRADNDKV